MKAVSRRGSPTAGPDPGGNGDPVLLVAGLSVSYGQAGQRTTAVREVSFDIGPGEILGLVGESGSGKSSVCGALMRLLPRSASMRADEVTFGGTDLTGLSARAMRDVRGSRLALIPQKPMTSLSPTTPIARQLRWYLGEEFDKPESRQLIIDLGLRAVLDRPRSLPSSFSGGQLQRLLILIAALVREPALVLADEPTTTLDATVQAQVLRLLLDVRGRVGAALLYV
ncbi:MAG: ATP-binding cassette domain-containing protein, partial [Trebonia sp.]